MSGRQTVAGDGVGDDRGDDGSCFLGPVVHQGHVPHQLTLSHPGRRALLLAPSCDEDADHKTAKSRLPSHTGSGTHPLALDSKFSPPHPTVPLWTQTEEICTCLNRPSATLPLSRHSAGSMPASAGRVCARHPLSGADSVDSGLPPWVPCYVPHTQSRQMGRGHRSGLGGSAQTRTVIQSRGACGHGGDLRGKFPTVRRESEQPTGKRWTWVRP